MIHEISPFRFDNQYLADKTFRDNDYILHFTGNTVLLKHEKENYDLPRKVDFPEISAFNDLAFLFSLDGVACFLVWDRLKTDKTGFVNMEMTFFRETRQKEIAWVCMVGYQLMNWYSNNRYCGKCGKVTIHKSDERAVVCPSCDTVLYPKISPAVIVAIVCKNKILLARNTNFTGGWYSLIAGYVDVGESLEEALVREVKEEVGLDVSNIRYYKSQPWPISASMMIGFVAEADEDQPINVDKKEIAEAAWFTRGNLPKHSLNISIAGEMIEKFESGEL